MKGRALVPHRKYLFYISEENADEDDRTDSTQWQGKQREMKNQIQNFADSINSNNTDLQNDISSVREKFEE